MAKLEELMEQEMSGPTEGQQKTASERPEIPPDPAKADISPPLVTDELDHLENAARKTSKKLLTDLFLLLIYLTGCAILFSIVYLIKKHVARQ